MKQTITCKYVLHLQCWRGYLSGARCKLAYGPADATATHCLLLWFLFKLAVTVHRCLNGRAPPYLSEHCIPVSSADTRRHLRSANRHLLAVPRFPLNTYGRRAFSVAGPMAWNLTPGFYPGSYEQHRQFWVSTQNVLVRALY